MKKPVIGYLSGPVDARDVYERWRVGEPTAYFGTSYLQHFFFVLSARSAAGHVVTSHEGESYDVRYGDVLISNRPRQSNVSGWRFHWQELRWAYRALRDVAASGSNIILLTDAQNYWFLTCLWRVRGVRFINALHCAVRPAFMAEPIHLRVLLWLSGLLHYRFGDPTLSASPLIGRQLATMPGARKRQVFEFLPSYTPTDFESVRPLGTVAPAVVRVLSAGRIERAKGVYDLLDAAEILKARRAPRIEFDVCGDGSELEALREATRKRNLGDCFHLHGFCDRNRLIEKFGTADIVVVPTRTEFEEGFAMIVAEGVIAGRPVVTSRVCPALEVVRDACVEVEPNDPAAYAEAIWALATDKKLARQKRDAASGLRQQFFDKSKGYGANLALALRATLNHDD